MRIAISGTHGVGKTTLIEDLVALHPEYAHEDEPFHQLEEQGASFSESPDVDGMIEQLDFSVALLGRYAKGERVLFDRCPIDFVAYARCIAERQASGDDAIDDEKLDEVRDAIKGLDLIVFLPLVKSLVIENVEKPGLRRAVDRELKRIYREDPYGFFGADGPEVVEISGSPLRRVEKLRSFLARR